MWDFGLEIAKTNRLRYTTNILENLAWIPKNDGFLTSYMLLSRMAILTYLGYLFDVFGGHINVLGLTEYRKTLKASAGDKSSQNSCA